MWHPLCARALIATRVLENDKSIDGNTAIGYKRVDMDCELPCRHSRCLMEKKDERIPCRALSPPAYPHDNPSWSYILGGGIEPALEDKMPGILAYEGIAGRLLTSPNRTIYDARGRG